MKEKPHNYGLTMDYSDAVTTDTRPTTTSKAPKINKKFILASRKIHNMSRMTPIKKDSILNDGFKLSMERIQLDLQLAK